MEVWQIVVMSVTIPAFLAWAAWVSLTAIRTEGKADKSLANDEQNAKDIESIGERWDNTAKKLEDGINRIESRLDIFLKSELDTLKQIAEK